MENIQYKITLKSDAELASGFGSKLIDSLLPRDIDNQIIIPASHLKGLMRENLEALTNQFLDEKTVNILFGTEKEDALFHIGNAVTHKNNTLTITRTALNEFGTAKDTSLRTTEAVSSETEFEGKISIKPNVNDTYIKLLKLALMSIISVGGARNRGAGACYIEIKNETQGPGELLKEIMQENWETIQPIKASDEVVNIKSEKQVTLKLVFEADDPICVPETPIIGNNVIKSGFTIPASAIQGMILHRLNDHSNELATECFNHKGFRAWPLNPTNNSKALALRVSFTHKVSKLTNEDDKYTFGDESIREFDWQKIPAKSPLKSSDGVLISQNNQIKLWKSSDMPRIISMHGVINGDRKDSEHKKRNLYSIEAMAPATYVGLLSMPETAAEVLKNSIKQNPFVQLGKSKSVRGGGEITIEDFPFNQLKTSEDKEQVFIVQSPLLIPESLIHKAISEIISKLVKDAGWGEVEKSSGAVKTQFGWNKTIQKGMLKAVAVIAPGAVFKLKQPLRNLDQNLVRGIGEGRERGFGAVLPHPGIAEMLYPDAPDIIKLAAKDNYAKQGYQLWQQAKESDLSASQISTVREILALDKDKAINHLDRQINERTDKIWENWKDIINDVKTGIQKNPEHYVKVLKVCQDLLVAEGAK